MPDKKKGPKALIMQTVAGNLLVVFPLGRVLLALPREGLLPGGPGGFEGAVEGALVHASLRQALRHTGALAGFVVAPLHG